MAKSSKRTHDEAAPASDAPMAVDTPSKAKKSKKDKDAEGDKEVDIATLCEIAKPLALAKTNKHVLKLVKKGESSLARAHPDYEHLELTLPFPLPPSAASKSRHLKRGVKEVVKSLRKGEKGIVVLAADISPLDILTHIPVLAEESNCPYIWVTSKESLGLASSTKRPTSCVMVAQQGMKRKAAKDGEKKEKEGKEKETEEEFQSSYEEVKKEVEALEETIPSY
ncbi:hypothetical protein JCM1840_002653 [Sporobolomyces johnsonii]